MSYARISTPFSSLGQFRSTRGYCFKLCPYSTAYRDKFTYPAGYIYGLDANSNPLTWLEEMVIGNTTNSGLQNLPLSGYLCTDHTTTSGRMEYSSHPPGWICKDPNCYYSTVIAIGSCYKET